MALIKKGRIWYMAYRDMTGRITSATLGTADRGEAEVLHREAMSRLHAEKLHRHMYRRYPGLKPPEPVSLKPEEPKHQRGGLKLAEMLPELEKIAPLHPTKRRIIARFIEWSPVKYADLVTPEMALQYLTGRFGSGRNYKAFNNARCALNAAFRQVLVQAKMAESPFERIACRAIRNVTSYRSLTDEEVRAILEECREPFRTAAMLAFYAGMDQSTARKVPCSAVRLKDRLIRWKRPKTGVWFTAGIHPELLEHLENLNFPQDSDVPLTDTLGKTGYSTWTHYYTAAFARLGIKDNEEGAASFHSLRATFFTRCDAAKLHRRTTSLAGGHTDDRMNDLYSHDVSAAHEVELLPPLKRGK